MYNEQYFIGIDSGSTMCKSVLFFNNELLDKEIIKTSYNPLLSAKEVYNRLVERNRLNNNNVVITSTGYGRDLIDFATNSYTEITCHSIGALHIDSNISAVIDIGGQDMKVIKIENGKVANFIMNDKCAAGTGRFLSMALDKLEIPFSDIDKYAKTESTITINSMCAVFAESEIISLLSNKKDRYDIISGVIHSIAKKVLQMISKLDIDRDKTIFLTGGLYSSNVIRQIIENTIKCRITTSEYSQFAGAIGSVKIAYNNYIKKQKER